MTYSSLCNKNHQLIQEQIVCKAQIITKNALIFYKGIFETYIRTKVENERQP